MKKVEQISVINVDGVPVSVSELDGAVRELVDIYNIWRQDESDQRLMLMKTQAALQDISRQIAAKIQEGKEKAEAPVEESNE